MIFLSKKWISYLLRFVIVTTILAIIPFFLFLRNTDYFRKHPVYQTPSSQLASKAPNYLDNMMRGPIQMDQENPILIQIIRNSYLTGPSQSEYNLNGETDDPSMGQSVKIMELLGKKSNGFYVECGALDGETRSNTLVFEKTLGWKGLLVEGDPENVKLIKEKHRKAHIASACLSTSPYPMKVLFQQNFNIGRISHFNENKSGRNLVVVQCLPLFSLLLALNQTKVDYFSLDVEGDELPILQSIPWDKVNITTLSVEFIHGKDGKEVLRKYMEGLGYRVYAEVTNPRSLANDFIFYHPKLLGKIVSK